MSTEPTCHPLRPRDFALLLLASRDLRPRQRARDQRADTVGLDLKRRILEQLAAVDPEPGEVDAALQRITEELGPPYGPSRAIATAIHEEWQMACLSPEWVAQLLVEASAETKEGGRATSAT